MTSGRGARLRTEVEREGLRRRHLNGCTLCAAGGLLRLALLGLGCLQAGQSVMPGARGELQRHTHNHMGLGCIQYAPPIGEVHSMLLCCPKLRLQLARR